MTTTIEPSAAGGTARARRDPGRYAGVAFGLTFLAGVVVWGMAMNIYGSDLDALAADSSGQTIRVLSMVNSHLVMPLASVLLLWTVARMSTALRAAGASPVAGQVAFGSAIVTAAGFCIMAGAQHVAVLVAGGGYIDSFPADPAVGYGIALLGGNVGNATVWGASALMVALGAASWRERLLPRWLIWMGYVTGVLLIAGWYFQLPVLLLCVWVAVASLTVHTDEG